MRGRRWALEGKGACVWAGNAGVWGRGAGGVQWAVGDEAC